MTLSLIRRKFFPQNCHRHALIENDHDGEENAFNIVPSARKFGRRCVAAWRHEGCSGNAIVEVALTMPILAFMLMGLFKAGMAFNNYLILESAVNQGTYAVANNASSEKTTDPCNLAYTTVSSVAPQFNAENLSFSMKLNNSSSILTGKGASFSCTIDPNGALKSVTPNDPVVLTVSYPVDMNILGNNFMGWHYSPISTMSATAAQNVQVPGQSQ